MTLRRIVPNLNVDDATTGHDFYEEFLGLRKEFDMGWVASFRSPTNPSVQVSLVSGDATAPEQSLLSVPWPTSTPPMRRRNAAVTRSSTHSPRSPGGYDGSSSEILTASWSTSSGTRTSEGEPLIAAEQLGPAMGSRPSLTAVHLEAYARTIPRRTTPSLSLVAGSSSCGRDRRGGTGSLPGALTVVSVLAPRPGLPSAEDPAWVGALGLVLAAAQGIPTAWRRLRPVAVAAIVLPAYLMYALIVDPVPPYAGWVVLFAVVVYSHRHEHAALRGAIITLVLMAAIGVVALISATGREAAPIALLITVVVALAAALTRAERGRIAAVRAQAALEERLRVARDLP